MPQRLLFRRYLNGWHNFLMNIYICICIWWWFEIGIPWHWPLFFMLNLWLVGWQQNGPWVHDIALKVVFQQNAWNLGRRLLWSGCTRGRQPYFVCRLRPGVSRDLQKSFRITYKKYTDIFCLSDVYIYMCIHTYIRTYIHTYIYIYIQQTHIWATAY